MAMANTPNGLIDEIEAFCAKRGLSLTAFGRTAMRDPNFCHDLKNGRSPTERTVTRARTYMENSLAGRKAKKPHG